MSAWQRCSSPAPPRATAVTCQVEGCVADLSLEDKAYCFKKRICSTHMRAEYIIRPGDNQQLWRFCFQCGKLEPLSQFDGPKRSCRARLERRKLPPRRSMTWTAGCARTSSTTTASSSNMDPAQDMHMQSMQLMDRIEEQRLLLEVQKQQQQIQMMQDSLDSQLLHGQQLLAPAGSAVGAAVSPNAFALLQQQRALVEQKQRHLQALRTALAQNPMPGLCCPLPGPDTPSVMHPGRASPTATGSLNSGHCSPSVLQQVPAANPTGLQFGAVAGMPALHPMAGLGQQPLPGPPASAQVGVPQATGAAAAAALAGSSFWPNTGTAAAAAAPAVPAAQAALLPGHSSADLEVCDEFDPLEAELTAAFPELEEELLGLPSLPQQTPSAVNNAPAGLAMPTGAGAFGLDLPAPQQQLCPAGLGLNAMGLISNQQCGSGLQLQLPQPQEQQLQQMQLQELMQTVRSLHEHVRELSLRVQGPVPTAAGAAP